MKSSGRPAIRSNAQRGLLLRHAEPGSSASHSRERPCIVWLVSRRRRRASAPVREDAVLRLPPSDRVHGRTHTCRRVGVDLIGAGEGLKAEERLVKRGMINVKRRLILPKLQDARLDLHNAAVHARIDIVDRRQIPTRWADGCLIPASRACRNHGWISAVGPAADGFGRRGRYFSLRLCSLVRPSAECCRHSGGT